MVVGSDSHPGYIDRSANLERWRKYLADSWGHLSPQWTSTTSCQASVLLRVAEDACNQLIEPNAAAVILRSYMSRILEDIRFARRNRLGHSEIWEVLGVSYPEWQVTGPEEPTTDPAGDYLEYLLKRYGANCPELLFALSTQGDTPIRRPDAVRKKPKQRLSIGVTSKSTLEAFDDK